MLMPSACAMPLSVVMRGLEARASPLRPEARPDSSS